MQNRHFIKLLNLRLLLRLDRGAEYCDERVCLSVCHCVCVCVHQSAIISSELHVRSSSIFSIRGTSHGPVSVRLSVRHKSEFY